MIVDASDHTLAEAQRHGVLIRLGGAPEYLDMEQYFVLHLGHLAYFHKRGDETALGCVSLAGCTAVQTQAQDEVVEHSHVFKARTGRSFALMKLVFVVFVLLAGMMLVVLAVICDYGCYGYGGYCRCCDGVSCGVGNTL